MLTLTRDNSLASDLVKSDLPGVSGVTLGVAVAGVTGSDLDKFKHLGGFLISNGAKGEASSLGSGKIAKLVAREPLIFVSVQAQV